METCSLLPFSPVASSPSRRTPCCDCWSLVVPAVNVALSLSATAVPAELDPLNANVHSAFHTTAAPALSFSYEVYVMGPAVQAPDPPEATSGREELAVAVT